MVENKTIIVNLFAGPGAGKSTLAAGLFYKLKTKGVNCELVTEFAKDITWKGNFNTLNNQLYVFAKQHDKIFHLKNKVDVIITDSPTIMGLTYTNYDTISKSFESLVVDEFNRDDVINVNFLLKRVKKYNPNGRTQTESEAKLKDDEIQSLLVEYGVNHTVIVGNTLERVYDIVVDKLNKIQYL